MQEGTKKSRQSIAATNTINAYRRLFATEDGQTVLKDLMRSCFITRSTLGPTTHDSYFNEGVRSVVLRLMSTVNMDEKQVERVMVEMNKATNDDVLF